MADQSIVTVEQSRPRTEPDGRIVFGCVYVALCLLAILIPVKVWGAERADACMAVGLDVSGSIHNEELRLQYDGLAAAKLHLIAAGSVVLLHLDNEFAVT